MPFILVPKANAKNLEPYDSDSYCFKVEDCSIFWVPDDYDHDMPPADNEPGGAKKVLSSSDLLTIAMVHEKLGPAENFVK